LASLALLGMYLEDTWGNVRGAGQGKVVKGTQRGG
jgi:hypothetical protein